MYHACYIRTRTMRTRYGTSLLYQARTLRTYTNEYVVLILIRSTTAVQSSPLSGHNAMLLGYYCCMVLGVFSHVYVRIGVLQRYRNTGEALGILTVYELLLNRRLKTLRAHVRAPVSMPFASRADHCRLETAHCLTAKGGMESSG